MNRMRNIFILSILIVMVGGLALNVKSSYIRNNVGMIPDVFTNDSLGERVYDKDCLTCHQKDGSGVPSMYPPVIDNPRVKGDKERLIKIILEGQTGRIEVRGMSYNGVMPPFKNLSDEEVASVLTYMRQNFENDTTAITIDEVKAVRDTL
ncbi:MAG: cytochrome c [Bacteroidales bacterium]|nr:cytochrome c [Bacteroidales bacterium]MBS3774874.1 cytochrome c [Bacteroidales bacterium]